MVIISVIEIVKEIHRPPKEVVEGFRPLLTGNIVDAMGRTGAMDAEIKPVFNGAKITGPALTVRTRIGDNLTCHKALELAKFGDVIVIDARGNKQKSPWGGLMSLFCKMRGIEGIVVDGAVRDKADITKMRYPVFSRTVAPESCVKEYLGAINVPIQCGGVLVKPGDVIVGDDDGVAVVPKEKSREVLEKSRRIAEKEEKLIEQIKKGELEFLIDVDEILRKKSR